MWSDEGQQSLFSWAEFMAEEPVKPKGRSRKPQPSTPSLFEAIGRSRISVTKVYRRYQNVPATWVHSSPRRF